MHFSAHFFGSLFLNTGFSLHTLRLSRSRRDDERETLFVAFSPGKRRREENETPQTAAAGNCTTHVGPCYKLFRVLFLHRFFALSSRLHLLCSNFVTWSAGRVLRRVSPPFFACLFQQIPLLTTISAGRHTHIISRWRRRTLLLVVLRGCCPSCCCCCRGPPPPPHSSPSLSFSLLLSPSLSLLPHSPLLPCLGCAQRTLLLMMIYLMLKLKRHQSLPKKVCYSMLLLWSERSRRGE